MSAAPLYVAHITAAEWAAINAENVALKAENRRLRDALETARRLPQPDERITREGD